VRGTSGQPFLGFSAGRGKGPATVRFRARAATAGPGKIEGLSGADQSSAQTLPFELKGGDWQTLAFDVPASFPLGILRLYLPAQSQPVEVDWVELKLPADTKPRRWNF